MTYVIVNGCCNDASCVAVCPVQCIRPRPGDPDFVTAEQLYIDPATCIDCGACMDECPVSAIHGEWDLPEELGDYLAINEDYFATRPIEVSALPDRVRRRLPDDRPALSVAIVGTGPAGLYAAAELSDVDGVTVSLLDRLPTPFGLVRAGVAPDHAATKQITKRLGSVLARANVQCLLNVEVGKDVTLPELLDHHHAVIWAAGATEDRSLGIPGEDLPGSVPAREFVAWYNGHPDQAHREHDLGVSRVVVIGNGNVAIDVARILAQPADRLERTETADHALEALRASTIEEIVVTARRGPRFAAYTAGEVTALTHVDGIVVQSRAEELADLPTDGRVAALLRQASGAGRTEAQRAVVLRYGLRPVSIDGTDRVESVTFEAADGGTETIPAGLVVRAIGYRGGQVDGLPFDETTGTVANRAGRVHDPATDRTVEGVYCSGWIKRGASGVIGTNRADSAETVTSLLDDFEAGLLPDPVEDPRALPTLLRDRGVRVVDSAGWQEIDKAERRDGRRARRPRRKLVTIDALLAASGAAGTAP